MRRSLSRLAASLALLGAALLAGHAAESAAAAEVRVVTPPIMDALPAYVASDQGFFKKHGLDVTLTMIANQQLVVSALMSKSAEIGLSVPPTIMQAKDSGIDQVIVAGATSFPHPLGYSGLVVRTGSGIHTVADFAGKKIAVAGLNAYHHLMAVDYLQRNGVDVSTVSFVEVPFPQQADVLKAGQVDAVVSVDPFFGHIVGSKIGYQIEEYDSAVPSGTMIDFYMSMRPWADVNSGTVKAFRDALSDGVAFIKANDAGARASLQRWTKQSEKTVADAQIPNFTVPVTAGQLDFWLDLAKRQKLVSHQFAGGDFVLK